MKEANFEPGTIFGIDFDGTCVTHEFPKVGKDVPYAVAVLKRIVKHGGKLILWTMRSNHIEKPVFDHASQPASNNPVVDCEADNYLDHAINWFKANDIPLWGCQCNPQQSTWTTSPKAYCHMYIDDAALGCPLITDKTVADRPFVDWVLVEAYLFNDE
jgi:hypothetical protein